MKALMIVSASLLLVGCGGGGSSTPDKVQQPVVVAPKPDPKPTIPANVIVSGDIEVKACAKYAGAICGITYKGEQIVDNHDFGRQFQTAINYNTVGGAEEYNPTEAGNFNDVHRGVTTSEMLSLEKRDNTLYTSTQMAYWLEPGQCQNNSKSCAVNTKKLSNSYVTKEASIGYEGFDNIIVFDVMFEIETDVDEGVNLDKPVQFQALATHTPGSWNKFYHLDNGEVVPLDIPQKDFNRDNRRPMISANADGSKAIALYKVAVPNYFVDIYSLKHAEKASSDLAGEQGIVAMFSVYRAFISAGTTHNFKTLVILGTLEEVSDTLKQLNGDV